MPMNFATHFNSGHSYAAFLEKYGNADQQQRWARFHARVKLTDDQKKLLRSFKREMKVLVMAGTWCGDCVEQCPIFEHFAAENPKILIRYVDRDADDEFQAEMQLCGAPRVPQVVFLSEDDHAVGRCGDRTLSKYRVVAANLDGATCSSGLIGPGEELLAAVTQDWLNEFERAQLILRTSGRLREKHGD
jgi:thiol-disulfide isomerase/thioredoxin